MHAGDETTVIGFSRDWDVVQLGIEPAVQVTGVNHYFGDAETRKQALTDNTVTLMPGEMVIMTGPSGSGKTTLLTLIGGLRTVQEGSVEVLGREMKGLKQEELTDVRRNIGFIFQAHNLFDSLTARQNVRTSLELHDHSGAEQDRLAIEMLTRLGLGERIEHKPQQLSGGQRQRVAIARALVNRPKLVLADEPTAALDKASGREVINLLKELAQTEKSTILLVTHDSRILDVADRIVNMVDGRIASEIVVEEAVTIIAFLRRCPVFENTPPAALAGVAEKMSRERYAPGSMIVRQGEDGDKFYLVREGTVNVLREADGNTDVIGTLERGDFFGEVALLSGGKRNATVVAIVPTVVYGLKKGDFLEALAASPTLDDQLRDVFFTRR
jgi:putative ABC transport system ATP-binding protein